MLRILKFGGALLKDKQGMQQLCSIVQNFNGQPLVVVVSALGKTTNALEELLQLGFEKEEALLEKKFNELKKKHTELVDALRFQPDHPLFLKLEELFGRLWEALHRLPADPYRAYDWVVGFGELFSSEIVQTWLLKNRLPVKLVDARQLLVTDENFTRASIHWPYTQKTIDARCQPLLQQGKIVLTQGFIAGSEKGNPVTLGREGSDFTAAVLAYALDATEVCIWKDVPGLMNGDPRIFPDVVQLPHVSYNEAIELAFYGASVIHPKTIQPLQRKKIPLKVCSFYSPETKPTLIDADESDDSKIPNIILKKDQTLLSISSRNLSFMAEENLKTVFSVFSRYKIHVNLMQNSAVSFSVCFDQNPRKLQAVFQALQELFILKYNDGLQLLTVRHDDGKVFEKLLRGNEIYLLHENRTTRQVLMRPVKK